MLTLQKFWLQPTALWLKISGAPILLCLSSHVVAVRSQESSNEIHHGDAIT